MNNAVMNIPGQVFVWTCVSVLLVVQLGVDCWVTLELCLTV